MSSKKKVTRIMKVTMDEDEFEKYDRGLTHSDKGLRNDDGKLSALPDIDDISEDDLPARELEYDEDYDFYEPSTKERAAETAVDFALNIITDPDVQETLQDFFKTVWQYVIKPKITNKIKKMNGEPIEEKTTAIAQKPLEVEEYEYEFVNEKQEKIVVSSEQAEKLVSAMKEEAKRLSAMIYILSNISIKDEKTDEEYRLEQSYIKQLASKEMNDTMKMLLNNKQLLDAEAVERFTNYLDGYVVNGEKKVRVLSMQNDEEQEDSEDW